MAHVKRILFALILGGFATAIFGGDTPQPTTRELNLINWMEFQKWVPEHIETVLLPTGTLEPHGVLPNGSDNLAPERMARELAQPLNAFIAPTLNYGVTGSMEAYPGAFSISREAYLAFVTDILKGLARNGFKNIIILNGHGGPQTAILKEAAQTVSTPFKVRILLINWWSLTADVTQEVFHQNGGHAGINETAYIQHIVPEHVHKAWYKPELAIPYPKGSAWSAVPFPATIGLYEAGEGYPNFDAKQASEYYRKVNTAVLNFIRDVIQKWDDAGLFR